jgi:hypothetical protein
VADYAEHTRAVREGVNLLQPWPVVASDGKPLLNATRIVLPGEQADLMRLSPDGTLLYTSAGRLLRGWQITPTRAVREGVNLLQPWPVVASDGKPLLNATRILNQ